jgi:hypothetical protein
MASAEHRLRITGSDTKYLLGPFSTPRLLKSLRLSVRSCERINRFWLNFTLVNLQKKISKPFQFLFTSDSFKDDFAYEYEYFFSLFRYVEDAAYNSIVRIPAIHYCNVKTSNFLLLSWIIGPSRSSGFWCSK